MTTKQHTQHEHDGGQTNGARRGDKNRPGVGSNRYRTAVGVAVAAGVFSTLVATLMLLSYLRHRPLSEDVTPVDTAELLALKAQLAQQPKDEALKEQLRQLDLKVRRDYFQAWAFADRGKYLLLVGVVALVGALKMAASCRHEPPRVPTKQPNKDTHRRELMWGRWAVTGLAAGLAAGVWALATAPTIRLATDEQEATVAAVNGHVESAENWPRFRGPQGSGVSPYGQTPTHWDGATGRNVLWKTPVPMVGQSSPVEWHHRPFLSGGNAERQQVYCYDADAGRLLWQKNVTVPTQQKQQPDEEIEIMEDTGYAAPTMAVDAKRAYAIFANGDVAAFDFAGKQLWGRNLGTPENAYGYASSLELHEGLLLIQYDQGQEDDDKSKMIALKGPTGETAWETVRPVANAWTSPTVVETGKGKQLVTVSTPWVIAYNPDDGTELWRANCMGYDVAPSPIVAAGLLLAVQPYDRMIAIDPNGAGDVTESHVAYTVDENMPDICSPVSDGRRVYLLTTEGTLSCYEAATGEPLWKHDFETEFHGSPTLADGRLYVPSLEGTMIILQPGDTFKEIGRAQLGEKTSCSPAFLTGRIYIRGEKNLYCIGEN